MQLKLIDSIECIPASEWNLLSGTHIPFLHHEFLTALERNLCVGEKTGWSPHIIIAEEDDHLIGAVPMYLKHHSFGEFVFDWTWANAYSRIGRDYYPKLVVAIPFTPITGPRILLKNADERVANALIDYAIHTAEDLKVSSLHWLFTDDIDIQRLLAHKLMHRTGCQYLWHNDNYADFDDFLDKLSTKKRKNIRRERQHVSEQDIHCKIIKGPEITEEIWDLFYQFYQATFIKHDHYIPLTPGFFKELGETMSENIFLIMASQHNRHVAGAIYFHDHDTLYGRYWGCQQEFHSLHFEVCYYRPIEYCIENHLKRFDAGAQGEHKIGRGFFPTATHSAHWIAEADFRDAIHNFLMHEQQNMQYYMQEMNKHLPYKQKSN